MGKLEGKVALITGAARGQGRSHAIRLAAEGADVVLVDLCEDIDSVPYPLATEADLEQTVKEVTALGRKAVARKVDVRDLNAMIDVVAEAESTFGRLDIVVANAGISPLRANTDDVARDWRDVIDVNLTGVFNTIYPAAPLLVSGGQGGCIVVIGSTASLKGSLTMKTVGGYGYAAAKHGVIGIMRTFAFELAPHNIRVNAVVPTGVDTPMVNNAALQELLMASPEAGAALVNLLPVQVIEPSDVSNAIAWLVSDEARYVTGITLPVDAGFTSK